MAAQQEAELPPSMTCNAFRRKRCLNSALPLRSFLLPAQLDAEPNAQPGAPGDGSQSGHAGVDTSVDGQWCCSCCGRGCLIGVADIVGRCCCWCC
eukprot:364686-Chlamydomonas_euryale.AAC.4